MNVTSNEDSNDENDKVWLTAVRIPLVLLLALVVLAVVGYVILH